MLNHSFRTSFFIALLITQLPSSGCEPANMMREATSRAPETTPSVVNTGAKPKACKMPAKPRNWAFDVLEEHLETCKGTSCAEVTLDGPITDEALATLSDRACFPKIVKLSLTNSGIQDAQAEKLVKAKNIRGIKHLGLTQGVLTDAAAKALAKAPGLKKLEHLDLSHNIIGARGAEAILQSKNLSNIHTLELSRNRVGRTLPAPNFNARFKRDWKRLGLGWNELEFDHIQALTSTSHIAGLKELELTGNRLRGREFTLLVQSKYLSKLKRLEAICDCQAPALRAFADSPHLTNLEHIDKLRGWNKDPSFLDGLLRSPKSGKLTHIAFSDLHFSNSSSFAVLARANDLHRLKSVELYDYSPMGSVAQADIETLLTSDLLENVESFRSAALWPPSHVKVLANSPALRNVKKLELKGGRAFNDAAAALLATSPFLKNIEELDLSFTKLGDKGLEAIANSPNFANLRVLNIKFTKITDVGIESLARSPYMANLEKLTFSGELLQITDRSLVALARSPHVNKLEKLEIRHNQLEDDAFHEFVLSGNFSGLKQLELSLDNVSTKELLLMTSGSMWRSLEEVHLHVDRLAPSAAKAIANSPGSNNIRSLHLDAMFDKGALEELSNAKSLTRLSELRISPYGIPYDELAPLLRSPLLSQLTTFSLKAHLDDQAAMLIAKQTLPRMRTLALRDNEFTTRGLEALLNDPDMAHYALDVYSRNIDSRGYLMLSESPHIPRRKRQFYKRHGEELANKEKEKKEEQKK